MEQHYEVCQTMSDGKRVLVTFKEAHTEWAENPILSIEYAEDAVTTPEIVTPEVVVPADEVVI